MIRKKAELTSMIKFEENRAENVKRNKDAVHYETYKTFHVQVNITKRNT